MNDIIFELQQGGLGRPLPGEDYISALLYYTADNKLPSGFSTTSRIKQIFSPAQALALGIKNDYSDATAATSTSTVTNAGANGDKITVTVTEPGGNVVTLAVYTKTANEADATAVATEIVALINAGTLTHGYSATTPIAAEIVIAAPKKLGIYLNTKSPVFTKDPTGSVFAITIGAFAGGVASLQAVWYYHISEYFRIQPKGNLFVAFYGVPGAYTFSELVNIQNFAQGKIRQFGVYKDGTALAYADVVALSSVCQTLIDTHKPAMAVLGADISGTADLTTLPDLSIRNSPWAMVDIGQDGAAQGAFLFATHGKSITTLGATLGALAKAKVNESIAWVGKFNLSDGTELDVAAIANGTLVMDQTGTIDENLLDELENRSYNFIRKFVGDAGTYRNETRTTISSDNDFAYAENVRTIEKAMRGVYAGTLPGLGAPIVLNEDGTLQDITIEYFRTLAEKNLQQMARDQEISNFLVEIDPTQLILQTGVFIMSVEIQPVGVARKIKIPIGFTVKTSA